MSLEDEEGFEMVQKVQRDAPKAKNYKEKKYSKEKIEQMNRFSKKILPQNEIPPFTNHTGPRMDRIGKKIFHLIFLDFEDQIFF